MPHGRDGVLEGIEYRWIKGLSQFIVCGSLFDIVGALFIGFRGSIGFIIRLGFLIHIILLAAMVREDVIFLPSYHQFACLGTDRQCFPVPVPRTDVRLVREDVIFLPSYHQFACLGTDRKCFPVPVPRPDARLVREDVIFPPSYHQFACLGTDRKCFPVPVPRTDARLVREDVIFPPSYQPGVKNHLIFFIPSHMSYVVLLALFCCFSAPFIV